MKANIFIILTGLCGFCSSGTLKIGEFSMPMLVASGVCIYGAILEIGEEANHKAFRLAIDELNKRHIVSQKIQGQIEYVEANNPFMAMTAACNLIRKGVVALLGPLSEENSMAVQSVCDDKDIPVLNVRWGDQFIKPNINLYPSKNMLTSVYVDILDAWKFKEFVILYDNYESLKRIGELLKFYSTNKEKRIIVRQLDREQSGNYRPILKEMWRSGATHFVLDCSVDILEEVLRQAQQVGLITNKQSYIITNFDFHTLHLTPFQYSETNITGIRFIDPDTESIRNLAFEIFKTDDTTDISFNIIAGWKLRIQTALIFDAIIMFGENLKDLPENFAPSALICESTDSWGYGSTLINLMKGNKHLGLSGYVQFDQEGYRSDFGVEVLELKEGGITTVGYWTTNKGLNITRVYPVSPPQDEGSLVNKTFVVITCLTEPYGMRKESAVPLYGNDRYEGFGIDLIHELSLKLGFNYTFIIREDKKNGEYDPVRSQWNGMIGDVINGDADLAITDLTITSEREEAVDFTSTFMSLGISILYQKPKKAPPSFFSFADPFSLGVWKLLSAAFFGASIAFFVLGRISPNEWQNPYSCIEQPSFLVNQLSLRNCFWFMTGSLMQQGSEVAPIATSTRMLAGMWWFFTLIMVSSYTANLAAFLTTESPDQPFKDVFDLAKIAEKKGIKYGAKINGSTANFFRDSKHVPEYQQIYQYMKDHENEVMVTDNKLGVLKAEKENYAFFMESTSIEYETQRRCSLTSIGGLLDEKGYGIAMRKNSTYRGVLTSAILKLQENGIMGNLKRKWWEERRGGGQCMGEIENSAATPLNLKNVGGVFWVTLIGSILSFILMFIEMFLHIVKRSLRTKRPVKELFMEEMKFYFKSSKMVKPINRTRSDRDSINTKSHSSKSLFHIEKKPQSYGFIHKESLKEA